MDDPHADLPGAIEETRRERRSRAVQRGPGDRPTIAVVAERPDDPLAQALSTAGWHVSGLLLGDVFDGLLWAARTEGVTRNYVELAELLVDPDLDAGCLAVAGASGAAVLPALLRARLHVLVPRPLELPVDTLRAAVEVADDTEVEHAVAFSARWHRSTLTLARLLADGEVATPQQVTVRGWPTGAAAIAELLDVVVGLCGDVVAVCAAPTALPATELPGGATVRWAVLTELGTTVLVAHDGAAEPVVRLSGPRARVEVTPDGVRAADGPVPLVAQPLPGLVATAARFAQVVGDGAEPTGYGGPGASPAAPATLRDLFVVTRLRDALRTSAVEDRWVETA